MRLAPTLLLSLPIFANAIRRTHLKFQQHNRALAQRQHREPRDLLDLCISIDTNLLVDAANLLGIGPLDTVVDLHLCLCLNDLDLFLDTDVNVKALIGLLGRDTVATLLTALLNTSPNARRCTLPPHAHRTCNNNDPCHYACDDPYVRNGNTCVCALPYTECNGQCGTFPNGCGSAVPRSLKPRSSPATTLTQAQASCKSNESVCGISGRERSLAYECVDTNVTLDSCGGCTTPHPFHESDQVSRFAGKECARLPNVLQVSCLNSRCVVSRCKQGWEPSPDKSACITLAYTGPRFVDNSSPGALRMRKERHRDQPRDAKDNANVVVNPDLLSKIVDYVNLVTDLSLAAVTLPSSPPSTKTPPGCPSPLDLNNLINGTVQAVYALLNSPTVSSLVKNINSTVDLNSLVKGTLDNCVSVDALGLGPLLTFLDPVIKAANGMQNWCQSHSAGVPALDDDTLTAGSLPSAPIPNTSDSEITVGLDDLLAGLGLGFMKTDIYVGSLGQELNKPTNDVLNYFGIGPLNARPRADGLDTNAESLAYLVNALVKLVVDVKVDSSSLPAPSPPTTPLQDSSSTTSAPSTPASLNQDLVNQLVQATSNLVTSATGPELLSNLDKLLDLSNLLQNTLNECGCVDSLGLAKLLRDTEKLSVALLKTKSFYVDHPVEVSAASPTDSSKKNSGQIFINADQLLDTLALGGILNNDNVTVDGLGDGTNDLVNSLLSSVGLGGRKRLRRQK